MDSSAFAALVQGGRCNNEWPRQYSVKYDADIDLQSCYGTALRYFISYGVTNHLQFSTKPSFVYLRGLVKKKRIQFAEQDGGCPGQFTKVLSDCFFVLLCPTKQSPLSDSARPAHKISFIVS